VTLADSVGGGPADPEGGDVGAFEDIAAQLGQAVENSGRAWMLAVLAASTGIVVPRSIDSIEEFREVNPVLDVAKNDPNDPFLGITDPNDQRSRNTAASPLGLGSPELADHVYLATPAQRRGFAIWAATRALERADLIDNPAILEALSMMQAGYIGPLPAAAAKLARHYSKELRHLATIGRPTELIGPPYRATQALLNVSYGRGNTDQRLADAMAYFDRLGD
jgi:hypothetical protein